LAQASRRAVIDVLHLIDTYRIGGPGKTIINSARFIDRTRFRVHVGSFTSLDDSRNEFAAAVRAADIPYLDLRETGRFNAQHIGLVRRYIRRHGIGLIHGHGYRTDALGLVAAAGTGAAVVTTHHGWIRNSGKQHAMARLGLQISRWLDGVEVVSEQLLTELPAAVVRSGKARVVHNAIVPEAYRREGRRDAVRAGLGVRGDAPLLGIVGRLSVEKGVLEALDAFEIIAAAVPAAHLVYVGEGPLGAALRERATAAGLSDRIHFTGHQRVQPYYEAFDLVVSPSRTEGLPNAILEALVFGLPVVATRVGGTPEIVQDDVSALLVPAEQPDVLARAVLRVLADPVLAARLIAAGTARVESTFTFPARMRKEERFYDDVLAARGSR
jgi:glycosyltransferase involved in cell wall biosynthesis